MEITDYTPDHAWALIDAFMRRQRDRIDPLVRHQISSYNQFIEKGIDNVVQGCSPIVQEYVEEDGTRIRVEILFDKIRIRKPVMTEKNGFVRPMYPNEARLRNDTYTARTETTLTARIHVTSPSGETTIHENAIPRVSIGSIPIMVGSKACPLSDIPIQELRDKGECVFDHGGYFIVNGGERVIMAQEMITENWLFVFQGGRGSKYLYLGELKSAPESREGFVRGFCIKMMRTKEFGDVLRVNIPKIRMDIPLAVLFKAIGILTDKAITQRVIGDLEGRNAAIYWKLLRPTLEEAGDIHTQRQALELLAKNTSLSAKLDIEERVKFVEHVLQDDFLPHLGQGPVKKGWFMGYSALRILRCSTGEQGYDDRDGYQNKRVELAGTLLTRLFYQYWSSKMIRDIRSGVLKELQAGAWKATRNFTEIVNGTNIFKILRTTTIDAGLKYSLATGNFGMKNSIGKIGVSQVLSRYNRNGTISHIRRLTTPVEKSGKLVAPRKLHTTSWGIVCPSETPEGESVGVVKNFSMLTTVTNGTQSLPIRAMVREFIHPIMELADDESFRMTREYRVWVNGDLMGTCEDGLGLLKTIRSKRARGIIHPMTTVYLNDRDLLIYTDPGRILRPLLRLNHAGRMEITRDVLESIRGGEMDWVSLIYDHDARRTVSWIEYLDVNEMNTSMILMAPRYKSPSVRYTHMEIHPSTILGTMASMIPFPDHNQAPRNTYQSAMGKQAMGIYATSYLDRMDSATNVLCYPQKPVVYTKMDKYFQNTDLPNGLNVVVAIMCFTGYNQEDSVLLNKASVERGLFRSFFYRTYRDEEKKNASTSEEEKFCRPDMTRTDGLRHGSYDKLNSEGFVPENTWVDGNDVIMGKVSPMRKPKTPGAPKKGPGVRFHQEEDVTFRDLSKTLRPNESGYIDRVYRNINGDGYYVMKIRVRSERIPTIGDKFSSRHGQKGTCGMIVPEEDMPFTSQGIRPDIIINPHAIPSRMTIAQIVECVLGKASCLTGGFGNGTPFEPFDIHQIADSLERHGMERYGNEILTSGITGEQLACQVFIGPTFYQRLKHMVDDKIHSRSSGPVVMLTRQPAEGRSRDGGHRFGEMERDCMISQGAAVFLKERMMDVSDKFPITVSKKSGQIAVVDPERGIYREPGDDESREFSHLEMPAAMKLLMQEIESMGILSRMITA